MTTYDLYGLKVDSLEEARALVEHALGVTFVAHESSYRGGGTTGKSGMARSIFILQKNFDPFDREWAEEAFREYATLLYVNETERPTDRQNGLAACWHAIRPSPKQGELGKLLKRTYQTTAGGWETKLMPE